MLAGRNMCKLFFTSHDKLLALCTSPPPFTAGVLYLLSRHKLSNKMLPDLFVLDAVAKSIDWLSRQRRLQRIHFSKKTIDKFTKNI